MNANEGRLLMTRKHGQVFGLMGATAALALLAAGGAQAQSIEELRARVEALEARQAESGRVKVPVGTTIEFGGYAKLDFTYDLDQGMGDTANIGGLTPGANDGGGFRARQSRFFFKTSTDTAQGPVNTHLEFDFFGGGGNQVLSNSYNPRLRHAYGTWNGILAGQTWTNFMPIEFYPNTLDFQGPTGLPFIRQAQLRYTMPVNDQLTISASLENSEFSGRNAAAITATNPTGLVGETTGNVATGNGGFNADLDELPDFTIAALYKGDGFGLKAAGLLRKLNTPQDTDDEIGWGINLSGSADLWQGGKLVASGTYGDGIGRYIIDGVGEDGFVDAAGNLHTIESWGAAAQVSHDFTNQVSAALAYSYYKVEDTFLPNTTDNLSIVHASLFYKPNKRVLIGAEVIYGERELANGQDVDATRLQTSFQFNF